MENANPYEPPQTPEQAPTPGGLTPNGYVPCPKCKSMEVTMPGFTWWGGVIGPKMLNHVKCDKCGHTYNGKTGGSNTGGIVVYSIVVAVILVGVYAALGL